MTFKQRIEWLFERQFIMFFLWEERFLNPLVREDSEKFDNPLGKLNFRGVNL